MVKMNGNMTTEKIEGVLNTVNMMIHDIMDVYSDGDPYEPAMAYQRLGDVEKIITDRMQSSTVSRWILHGLLDIILKEKEKVLLHMKGFPDIE